MLVRIGDVGNRIRFGVVEIREDEALRGISFIDRCIWKVFPRVRKVVPLHSSPVAILTRNQAVTLQKCIVSYIWKDLSLAAI